VSVKGANGEKRSFTIDPNTRILSGKKKITLGDLEVSDSTAIDGDTKGDLGYAT
jgi:hypothetical protein